MANTKSQVKIDIRWAPLIWPYTEMAYIGRDYGEWFWSVRRGEVDMGSIVENALAYKSNGLYVGESVNGRDFSDGSDAKKATARRHGHKDYHKQISEGYRANVSKVGAKEGDLRVIVYERNANRLYFFLIPYAEHKGYTTIDIPFIVKTSMPYRKNHWWKHEVGSFEELATAVASTTVVNENLEQDKDFVYTDYMPPAKNEFWDTEV